MRYSTTPFSLSRVTGPISEHKGEGVHFVPIRQHIAPERKITAAGLLRALGRVQNSVEHRHDDWPVGFHDRSPEFSGRMCVQDFTCVADRDCREAAYLSGSTSSAAP